MKNNFYALALIVLASMSSQGAQASTSETLTFKGTIEAPTCELNPAEFAKPKTLPTVKATLFDQVEAFGSEKIKITAKCESGLSHVTFEFTGTQDPDSSYRFLNTGTSKNLGLWLRDTLGTIRADGTNNERTIPLNSSGEAIIEFEAGYFKIFKDQPVTFGSFESKVVVKITYK